MSFEYEDIKQKGTLVEVHNNDINKAMRKLKKVVQAEGIFQTLRDRERFEKPSVKRKKEMARAVKRWQKKIKDYREQGKTSQIK
jgi:small subunit ribosomal protein S21